MRNFILPIVTTSSAVILSATVLHAPQATAQVHNGHQAKINAQVNVNAPGKARSFRSDRTYSVTVDGGENESRNDIFQEALSLAARKTLRNGYEWFEVVNRETDKETVRTENDRVSAGFHREPETTCGLLGCTTRYRTHYRGGFASNLPDEKETVYSVTLDFYMGSGNMPRGEATYDAKSVRATG